MTYVARAAEADYLTRSADHIARLLSLTPSAARAQRAAASAHLQATRVAPNEAAAASHRQAALRHFADANRLAARRATHLTSIRLSRESFLRYLGIVPATQAVEGQA